MATRQYPTIRLNLTSEEMRALKRALFEDERSMSDLFSEYARQYLARKRNESKRLAAPEKIIDANQK